MTYKRNPRLGNSIYFGTTPEIIELARHNRNGMTQSERNLWNHLRKRRFFGMKWRRQHPISRFIADFYCHEAGLIIELDGGYHDGHEQSEYDRGREVELEILGLKILRFRNEEVDTNPDHVLFQITKFLLSITKPNEEGNG